MRLANLTDLRARLVACGGGLQVLGTAHYCDAPSGYTWDASGGTCLMAVIESGDEAVERDALDDLAERVGLGLSRVVDPADLDILRHLHDDNQWGAALGAPDRIEWV